MPQVTELVIEGSAGVDERSPTSPLSTSLVKFPIVSMALVFLRWCATVPRTGTDAAVDFMKGESVVALAGKRVFSASAESSTAFTFTWSFGSGKEVIDDFQNSTIE